MAKKFDRFFNPKDGTYANVPIIPVHPEKFRGKRFFGARVLIGNWYEDHSKFKESTNRSKSFYKIDYPHHVGSVPDTVVRRKIFGSHEERPGRMILDHHDIDNEKQRISSYDEHYMRRGPYGNHRETSERRWALQENVWLPERSDHPLQSTPTNWGLLEKKHLEIQSSRKQRQTPNKSEYADRYPAYPPELYSSSRYFAVPRIYTRAVDRSNSTNKFLSDSFISNCSRQATTSDTMETDHLFSLRRNTHVPRAYFYLGRTTDHRSDATPGTANSVVTETLTPMRSVTSLVEPIQYQEQTV